MAFLSASKYIKFHVRVCKYLHAISVFVCEMVDQRKYAKPYFQKGPLSEAPTLANPQQAVSSI